MDTPLTMKMFECHYDSFLKQGGGFANLNSLDWQKKVRKEHGEDYFILCIRSDGKIMLDMVFHGRPEDQQFSEIGLTMDDFYGKATPEGKTHLVTYRSMTELMRHYGLRWHLLNLMYLRKDRA